MGDKQLVSMSGPLYPLSSPGPKEMAVASNAYQSRGYPMAHHLYRHYPGANPWYPSHFHGYPYDGPVGQRYTPDNQYSFGYPHRGIDADRVAGSEYTGPVGTADHSAHYEGHRLSGAFAGRNTSRTVQEFSPAAYYSMPRSDAYPYGYGHYHGHAHAMYGVPVPDVSSTYDKQPGGRFANTVAGETVAVPTLTTVVTKQPVL